MIYRACNIPPIYKVLKAVDKTTVKYQLNRAKIQNT